MTAMTQPITPNGTTSITEIGIDQLSGQARLSFGMPELLDGVEVTTLAVAMFAIGEALYLASQRWSGKDEVIAVKGSLWMNRQDWKRSWRPWLRGTAIGFPIGAMPAGGAEIGTFLSYAVEKKMTKHPEEFGEGAIEGVAGPEAANNASAAGTLVPLLTLGLPTSPYRFVDTVEDYRAAVAGIGLPCVVKPVMSSSGKGQSKLDGPGDVDDAWRHAAAGGRVDAGRVIVEGFIDFDYEITLLTIRHAGGTSFCEPIGHLQHDGDYRESWQPQPMSPGALARSRDIARAITDDLGGWGVFGVELFVKGDEVWFSEVSPRPHDTGLVTLVSQELSEFALHARAILGLPVPVDADGTVTALGASASCALLAEGHGVPAFAGVEAALRAPDTALRLFGKPRVEGQRRVGVTLARAADVDAARTVAREAAAALTISLD